MAAQGAWFAHGIVLKKAGHCGVPPGRASTSTVTVTLAFSL